MINGTNRHSLSGHVLNLHLCNFPISRHPCEGTFKKFKKGKFIFSKMFADLHSVKTNEPQLQRGQTVGNCKDDSGRSLSLVRSSDLLPLTEKSKSAFT